MPLSTKLTLLVLVLPIGVLSALDLAIFYYLKTGIEFTVLLTIVSAIFLVVWDKLRDSLSKKLEYLHKNFLFKLYTNFSRPSLFWTQDEIKRLRVDLEKYGEFINLKLYPKKLLREIDEFLSSHTEFYKRLKEIEGLAEKQFGKAHLHRDLVWNCIGLYPDSDISSYTDEVKKQYKEWGSNIVKNSLLVSEAKDYVEKTQSLGKQILNGLEDFLKSNNLRLEAEPSTW